jgi:hypothetical protein
MKTFAISLLAAAAAFFLVAIFLRRPTSQTSPITAQPVPAATVVDETPSIPARQAAAMPPSPPKSVISSPAPEKMPAPPITAKASPRPTPTKPTADATPPSPPISESVRAKQEPKLTTADKLTLAQTSTTDTSLRNPDYPRTYISAISVDLASPLHAVRLTWSGPEAASQETGPFHSSPGRGTGANDCDDPNESNRQDSNCTPKGTFRVQGFSNAMPTYAHCKFVTWFLLARGIAFHSYPGVADYPASHGCVRLEEHAAQLIHNNTKIGATEVTVGGHWAFGR